MSVLLLNLNFLKYYFCLSKLSYNPHSLSHLLPIILAKSGISGQIWAWPHPLNYDFYKTKALYIVPCIIVFSDCYLKLYMSTWTVHLKTSQGYVSLSVVTRDQATSHLLLQGGANAPPWLRQGGAFSIQGGAL